MSDQQHTSGPWVLGPLNDTASFQVIGRGPIGPVEVALCEQFVDRSDDEELTQPDDNARRIVACVNAMEGIPDPADYMRKVEALEAAVRCLPFTRARTAAAEYQVVSLDLMDTIRAALDNLGDR